jgi:flagellar protein FliS
VNTRVAVASYNQIKTGSALTDATPHKLIDMLFDGAIERIAQAKGAMEHKNIELKGAKINSAINIVNGLRENLNHDDSEEIAGNLENLYEYIVRVLNDAHRNNDPSKLDEATTILGDIASAWKQIA